MSLLSSGVGEWRRGGRKTKFNYGVVLERTTRKGMRCGERRRRAERGRGWRRDIIMRVMICAEEVLKTKAPRFATFSHFFR